MLPEEIYDFVWQRIDAETTRIEYSQVIMPLSALLEGDFFNVYIKSGSPSLSLSLSSLWYSELFTSGSEFPSRQYLDAVRRSTWD